MIGYPKRSQSQKRFVNLAKKQIGFLIVSFWSSGPYEVGNKCAGTVRASTGCGAFGFGAGNGIKIFWLK